MTIGIDSHRASLMRLGYNAATISPNKHWPSMSALTILEHSIEAFTEITGRILAWLTLVMMLTLCLVVALRYGFEIGSVALQESVTYMHGCIFMLGAAYTLKHDGHVRVDIFYRRFSPRAQAWVNCLGCILFLLPLCVFIFCISWDFVAQSWWIREVSSEPGGIPAVFLLKTLIPLMSVNLGLQATAQFIRNARTLVETQEAT